MSLLEMENAVSIDFLKEISQSLFVQKFMNISPENQSMLDHVDELTTQQANELMKYLFANRYRAVNDLSIALNEMLDRTLGNLPISLSKEAEWDGYINATEEPIKCLLSIGTELNLLEFLQHPQQGFIFQITLGEGEKGKHFNVPMDEALDKSDKLVELVQTAQNIRAQDLLNGINV